MDISDPYKSVPMPSPQHKSVMRHKILTSNPDKLRQGMLQVHSVDSTTSFQQSDTSLDFKVLREKLEEITGNKSFSRLNSSDALSPTSPSSSCRQKFIQRPRSRTTSSRDSVKIDASTDTGRDCFESNSFQEQLIKSKSELCDSDNVKSVFDFNPQRIIENDADKCINQYIDNDQVPIFKENNGEYNDNIVNFKSVFDNNNIALQLIDLNNNNQQIKNSCNLQSDKDTKIYNSDGVNPVLNIGNDVQEWPSNTDCSITKNILDHSTDFLSESINKESICPTDIYLTSIQLPTYNNHQYNSCINTNYINNNQPHRLINVDILQPLHHNSTYSLSLPRTPTFNNHINMGHINNTHCIKNNRPNQNVNNLILRPSLDCNFQDNVFCSLNYNNIQHPFIFTPPVDYNLYLNHIKIDTSSSPYNYLHYNTEPNISPPTNYSFNDCYTQKNNNNFHYNIQPKTHTLRSNDNCNDYINRNQYCVTNYLEFEKQVNNLKYLAESTIRKITAYQFSSYLDNNAQNNAQNDYKIRLSNILRSIYNYEEASKCISTYPNLKSIDKFFNDFYSSSLNSLSDITRLNLCSNSVLNASLTPGQKNQNKISSNAASIKYNSINSELCNSDISKIMQLLKAHITDKKLKIEDLMLDPDFCNEEKKFIKFLGLRLLLDRHKEEILLMARKHDQERQSSSLCLGPKKK